MVIAPTAKEASFNKPVGIFAGAMPWIRFLHIVVILTLCVCGCAQRNVPAATSEWDAAKAVWMWLYEEQELSDFSGPPRILIYVDVPEWAMKDLASSLGNQWITFHPMDRFDPHQWKIGDRAQAVHIVWGLAWIEQNDRSMVAEVVYRTGSLGGAAYHVTVVHGEEWVVVDAQHVSTY